MSDLPEYGSMIQFLKSRILRSSNVSIDVDTRLVSSGILDSFALIDVVLQLEKITARKIPPGRVSPLDLDTVRQMFLTADRVGIQR